MSYIYVSLKSSHQDKLIFLLGLNDGVETLKQIYTQEKTEKIRVQRILTFICLTVCMLNVSLEYLECNLSFQQQHELLKHMKIRFAEAGIIFPGVAIGELYICIIEILSSR